MKTKIEVVPYNPDWPKVFKIYEKELKEALRDNCMKVYHVGSTSVPGLCAKPKIDIMCVVKDLQKAIRLLERADYEPRGEFNLPLRLFFRKRYPDSINLHVVNENSGEIEWNLTFQNYLRDNKKARDLYAKTKLDLVKENPEGFDMLKGFFTEYTVKKGDVILKIAKEAGFSGYRFVIATNYNEIDAYKRLLNLENIDFKKNVFNLCLYKGVDIVAAACVEFDDINHEATIVNIKSLDKEFQKIFLDKISEWTNFYKYNLTQKMI